VGTTPPASQAKADRDRRNASYGRPELGPQPDVVPNVRCAWCSGGPCATGRRSPGGRPSSPNCEPDAMLTRGASPKRAQDRNTDRADVSMDVRRRAPASPPDIRQLAAKAIGLANRAPNHPEPCVSGPDHVLVGPATTTPGSLQNMRVRQKSEDRGVPCRSPATSGLSCATIADGPCQRRAWRVKNLRAAGPKSRSFTMRTFFADEDFGHKGLTKGSVFFAADCFGRLPSRNHPRCSIAKPL